MIEGNFKQSIGGLLGVKIGFYLNDNQFIEGILLDVKRDHLIVNVNQSVIYFALNQIRAFSKNAKDFRVSSQVIPYLNKDQLTDILNDLKYSWVTINCLSNETFAGVLSRIYEDHIILVNNSKRLFVQQSYISNIYKGVYESIDEPQKSDEVEDTEQTQSSKEEPIQPSNPLVQLSELDSGQIPEPESVLPPETKFGQISEPKSILSSETKFVKISELDFVQIPVSEPVRISEPKSGQIPQPETGQFSETQFVQLTKLDSVQIHDFEPVRISESKSGQIPQPESALSSETKFVKISELDFVQIPVSEAVQIPEPESSLPPETELAQLSEPEPVQIPEPESSLPPETEFAQLSKLDSVHIPESKPVQFSEPEPIQIPEPESSLPPETESVQIPELESALPPKTESVQIPELESVLASEPELSPDPVFVQPSKPDSVLLFMPELVPIENKNRTSQKEQTIDENDNKFKNGMLPQDHLDSITTSHYNNETDDENPEMDESQIHIEEESIQNTYVTPIDTNEFQYGEESNDTSVENLNTVVMNKKRKIRRKFKLTKSNSCQKEINSATSTISSFTNKKTLKPKHNSLNKDYQVYSYHVDSNNQHTEPLFSNSLCVPKHMSHKEEKLDKNSNILANNLEYNHLPTDTPTFKMNSPKEDQIILEKQYFALMKHAERMYLQLKNERLKK
ncbi:MAG TPA: hypothetical protein VNU45_11315 [Rummeliibacillus sp.]|nr:hypothetical protein [Rummeliibacillus sp.]